MAADQGGAAWWSVLVQHYGLDDLQDVVAEFHLRVSTKMVTHLQLPFENVELPQWLCAGMLSPVPHVAQEAASELVEHLVRRTGDDLSAFDQAVKDDSTMFQELCTFADCSPPVLLWRGNGAFRHLFIFTAVRFLG